MEVIIVVVVCLMSLFVSRKLFREAKTEADSIQRFHIQLVGSFFFIYGFGAGLLSIIVRSFGLWGNSW